jgi:predicted TIM-barrel fold metal-dependent hydrolase
VFTQRSLIAAAAGLLLASGPRFNAASAVLFKLYDTHSHLFTNDIEHYPINTSNAQEGAENLRQRILTNPSTVEHILEQWDANGIEGGVGVQYNSSYKTDNSYLLDSEARFPARVAAVVILDATDPGTPAKLKEMAERRGISGVRLTGFPDATGAYPWLESPAAQNTWAQANALHLAVVLMYLPPTASSTALAHIGILATRYPKTRIVLDHIGWPQASGAPDYGLTPAYVALAKHRNVFYKFTTINLDSLDKAGISPAQFLRHAVAVFGADHLMWGSDFGNTPGEYSTMVERAIAATSLLKPRDRRRVLHDTGEAVFERPTHG